MTTFREKEKPKMEIRINEEDGVYIYLTSGSFNNFKISTRDELLDIIDILNKVKDNAIFEKLQIHSK